MKQLILAVLIGLGVLSGCAAERPAPFITTADNITILLPPGEFTASLDPDLSLRHTNGSIVSMDSEHLVINGQSYKRPSSGSTIDLRQADSVLINGAAAPPL